MQNNHTPGPWETSAGLADDGQTIEWEICAPGGGDMIASLRGNDNAEADANLAAAAPAMLAALEGCANALAKYAHIDDAADDAADDARAIIALATSGTPTAQPAGDAGTWLQDYTARNYDGEDGAGGNGFTADDMQAAFRAGRER